MSFCKSNDGKDFLIFANGMREKRGRQERWPFLHPGMMKDQRPGTK
jgi:hypothetical protein